MNINHFYYCGGRIAKKKQRSRKTGNNFETESFEFNLGCFKRVLFVVSRRNVGVISTNQTNIFDGNHHKDSWKTFSEIIKRKWV